MPSINIDLQEVYDDLTHREKRELIDWLDDDGYIEPHALTDELSPVGLYDEEVKVALRLLLASFYRLSNSDREVILNMAKNV
jgi:hypothetical protein